MYSLLLSLAEFFNCEVGVFRLEIYWAGSKPVMYGFVNGLAVIIFMAQSRNNSNCG